MASSKVNWRYSCLNALISETIEDFVENQVIKKLETLKEDINNGQHTESSGMTPEEAADRTAQNIPDALLGIIEEIEADK